MTEKKAYHWAYKCIEPIQFLHNQDNNHRFEQVIDKIASAILESSKTEAPND